MLYEHSEQRMPNAQPSEILACFNLHLKIAKYIWPWL